MGHCESRKDRIKILVSACIMGHNVRWNGTNKKAADLIQWAHENNIDLVAVCPEDALFGTPRPPIRMVCSDGETIADMKGVDVLPVLNNECKKIYSIHSDASGFIGISKSPSCGISVGVKNLGKTIKGTMHKTSSVPTVEYNQIRTDTGKHQFLRRVTQAHEYIRSR